MNRLNTLHLGVIGTALAGLLGIIACTLTHTAIPEGLITATTTAVGALAGVTAPAVTRPTVTLAPPAPKPPTFDYGIPGAIPAATQGAPGGQA